MSHTGTCKFFNAQKGYGFITGADNQEYFVHFSAINADGHKSLANGEAVQFDLQINPANGKQCASNVTGPNGAPVTGQQRQGFGQGFGGQGGQQGGFGGQQSYGQQGGFGGQPQGGYGQQQMGGYGGPPQQGFGGKGGW